MRLVAFALLPGLGAAGCIDQLTTDLGGNGAEDLAACTAVTARPDVSPWQMRLAGTGAARITSAGDDVFLQSPNGKHELGIRMSWGGSATFFGNTGDPNSNVIDTYDRGRELQVALYDRDQYLEGCAANASCASNGAACGQTMSFLGWDPVQAGDRCGNGASATWAAAGETLRVVAQPLQWNPDWNSTSCANNCIAGGRVAGDVTFTQEYRFLNDNVIEMSFAVANNGTRAREHDQEFPTFYVSSGPHASSSYLPASPPDLYDLIDANGHGVSFAPGSPLTIESRSSASGNAWVTWQDRAHGYGVAFAMDEGISTFRVFHESFYNVRPRIHIRIEAGATVRGRAYLALGNLDTVSSAIDGALSRRAPFGVIDAPAQGATHSFTAGTPIQISGWVLDSTQIESVQVRIDGKIAATIPVNVQRDDVCAVFPAYAGCPNFFAGSTATHDRTDSAYVGYSGSVATSGLSRCEHLLQVLATDGDGNTSLLGERVIQQK
jgi:hypothetical protein